MSRRRGSHGSIVAIAVAAATLVGCPPEDIDPPEVAGTFPLLITLLDGDCLAQDPDLPPTAFLTWLAANGQAGMLEIEQEETDLEFHFEGCDLGGTVDAEESYYAGGECATDPEGTAIVTSYGTLGPAPEDSTVAALDGYLRMDVDYRDPSGGSQADGEDDCFREVQLTGTSF